ncbi:hypothetical protein EWM64_g3586 [Hericium alpestre]|uniref:3-beta hydroxysteroid dehydrogenase/isomerase domain-containing protein n=1 Tax=Hericium alpestre TaxID=135208 RepID=A0A4Z0A2A0_9AGAM|nr:hypothetical protein EWM64_g3586 [Hericium alpestre]
MSSDSPAHYLVVGGAGFLGSHIVQALVDRGEQHVAVYDPRVPASRERIQNVLYIEGDICDFDKLLVTISQNGTTVVFHTASPIHGLAGDIYSRVNVAGTKTLLKACEQSSVHKLIYTSSTGVVWTGADLHGVSESQAPIPQKGYDAYHHTKAVAENLILSANGDGLRTVALRPCGMIGPGDLQLLPRMVRALAEGQHKVQIGNNTNLIDWAYVGNVADAHLLAADRLPPNGVDAPFSDASVAGQVFFITNGTPMPSWDVTRKIWRELGAPAADLNPKNVTKIPVWLALCMAYVAEFWAWLTRGTTEFNRYAVLFTSITQWYNIDKARYQPKVSIEDAIHEAAEWWKKRAGTEADGVAQSEERAESAP